jgi:hypothetical protein
MSRGIAGGRTRHVLAAVISAVAYLSLASASLALPESVATPIQNAKSALAKTQDRLAARRYARALDSLAVLRRNVTKANNAAKAQIGLPPADPESDDPPGPPCVFAVLKLDDRITMRLVPRYDGLRRSDVVSSLNSTLRRTHGRRDSMLDAVIGLPAEGARADFDDGMADTLAMYPAEETLISGALENDALIASAQTGLTNALARVHATEDKANGVWGGGE